MKDTKIIEGLFKMTFMATVGSAMIAPLIIIEGVALKLTWNWFVPMAIHSAPRLNLGEAVGLALVMSVINNRISPHNDERSAKQLAKQHAYYVGGFGLIVAMGWILHTIIA